MRRVTVKAHPSLALIKYWGKSALAENIPATSSLAVGLKALTTETTLSFAERDAIVVDGNEVEAAKAEAFFERARAHFNVSHFFHAESNNDFPTAAGCASSSSGYAALALALALLLEVESDSAALSKLARYGSASAARALFSGITIFPRHAECASQLFSAAYWPQLRVIVCIVKKGCKKISSRRAMESVRKTSPFYDSWLDSSEQLYQTALQAIAARDLRSLGPLMQQSYLQMFSTIWSARPPIFYWEPETLALIDHCAALRQRGIDVWETMDAGPQVKMICEAEQLETIIQSLECKHPDLHFLVSQIADEPSEPQHSVSHYETYTTG